MFVSFFTSFLPLFFYKYLFLSSFWVVVIDTVRCSRSGSSNESDNFYFLDRNFGKRKLLRGIDTIRPVQLVPFGRWGWRRTWIALCDVNIFLFSVSIPPVSQTVRLGASKRFVFGRKDIDSGGEWGGEKRRLSICLDLSIGECVRSADSDVIRAPNVCQSAACVRVDGVGHRRGFWGRLREWVAAWY